MDKETPNINNYNSNIAHALVKKLHIEKLAADYIVEQESKRIIDAFLNELTVSEIVQEIAAEYI